MQTKRSRLANAAPSFTLFFSESGFCPQPRRLNRGLVALEQITSCETLILLSPLAVRYERRRFPIGVKMWRTLFPPSPLGWAALVRPASFKILSASADNRAICCLDITPLSFISAPTVDYLGPYSFYIIAYLLYMCQVLLYNN